MSANLSLPTKNTILKNIITGLSVFIFWSLLAIIDVFAQPVRLSFSVIPIFGQSDNLAFSIAGEIIASYLSPFAILNMLLIFFAFCISSKLRVGISQQLNPQNINTADSFSSFVNRKRRHIIKLIDFIKEDGSGILSLSHPFTSPAALEIPANMAVVLEADNREQQVITGINSEPLVYWVEKGAHIVNVFPLNKHAAKIIMVTTLPSGEENTEEWILRYSFPEIRLDNQTAVDPRSLIVAANCGDSTIWKYLVETCILSALTSAGLIIADYRFERGGYIKLKNFVDFNKEIPSQSDIVKKIIPSHSHMYKTPLHRVTHSNQSLIRRNRKFTRSAPLTVLIQSNRGIQPISKINSKYFNFPLQQKVDMAFQQYINRIYGYPIAIIKFDENAS